MTKIILPKSDEKLLELCRVETYRSSGSGGQHVNTTDSAVRLTYLPTRIVVTSQTERSQYMNKQRCIQKLRDKVDLLNYVKPYRVPTKVPYGKKMETLQKKTQHGSKKKLRGKIKFDE